MSETAVKVKSASVKLGEKSDDWFQDPVILTMSTEDEVDIQFHLDPMAAILLSLTLGPTLALVKERAESQKGAL